MAKCVLKHFKCDTMSEKIGYAPLYISLIFSYE